MTQDFHGQHDESISRMTNAGACRPEIAEHLGMTIHQVRYRQIRLGVMPDYRGSRVRHQGMAWSKKVQTMWDSDMSLSAIARTLGVTRNVVICAATRKGLWPRNKVKAAPRRPKSSPTDALTPDQFADVQVYRRAGYTLKDAIAKVTAPKTKIRFAAPVQPRRARVAYQPGAAQ